MATIVDFVAFDLSVKSLLNETSSPETAESPIENPLRSSTGELSVLSGGIIKDGMIDVSLMMPDGSVSTAKQDISESESRAIELARKGWVVVRVSTIVNSLDE